MDVGIIILGIIQGIAEFLPISSSAHLLIFRDLFLIGKSITTEMSLLFDIALHFGTLLAIVVYFFKDFLKIFINGVTKGYKNTEGKIFYLIILATIPAAVVGLLFEENIESIFRSNFIVIALALIIMGVIIYYADKISKQEKDVGDMTFNNALLIGVSQIFALVPGFSRSGTTIAAGRLLKLDRTSAAKFSFYLSAPIVLGATIVQLLKDNTVNLILSNISIFSIGMISSFIAGILCIEFLLKYLKKNDFKIFMIYRIILGIVVLLKIF